jgi:hypothetical protein
VHGVTISAHGAVWRGDSHKDQFWKAMNAARQFEENARALSRQLANLMFSLRRRF